MKMLIEHNQEAPAIRTLERLGALMIVCRHCATFEQVAIVARILGFWTYQGGRHLAIHPSQGEDRMALVIQAAGDQEGEQ